MSRSISGANHDRKNEVFEVAFDGKQEDEKASGVDALRGNTRTHPEHDG